MNLLVATTKTQGQRENDFNCCAVNEPVMIDNPCDGGFIDDDCGCRRSLVGVIGLMGTTTVEVIETESFIDDYLIMVRGALIDEGRVEPGNGLSPSHLNDCNRLLEEAAKHPVGTVLEYRGGEFSVRGE